MRGLFLLSISFLLFANLCVSQKDSGKYHDKKFTFGWSIGQNYPKGDFFKADQSNLPLSKFTGQDTNKINGYALKGFHYDVYVTYRIIPHLSIMLSVEGDRNLMDINTLNSQYIQYFPLNTISTGNEYYITQYLAGPYLNFHVSKNYSIECKALAGYTTAYNPDLTYSNSQEMTIYTFPEGSGFEYNIGAGIKYSVEAEGKLGLGLHLNVDYAGSNISYPNYSVTNYSGNNFTFTSYTYNVPKSMAMAIVQITLGASLEL